MCQPKTGGRGVSRGFGRCFVDSERWCEPRAPRVVRGTPQIQPPLHASLARESRKHRRGTKESRALALRKKIAGSTASRVARYKTRGLHLRILPKASAGDEGVAFGNLRSGAARLRGS